MYRWELDEPAEGELAGLGKAVRKALAEFMDAVVIGLVAFLIYPPDDLVLVVKIQWIGD